MSIQKSLGAAGLWISPSPLQAPVGAYILADNVVVSSPGVVESRRGFSWLPYVLGAGSSSSAWPKASFSYGTTLLVQYAHALAYNTGATMTEYSGTFDPPAPSMLRMKSEEVGLNLYFTSLTGVYGLDNVASQPRLSGLDPGPLPTAVNHKTDLDGTASGWMPPNSQTAYVTTLFRTDVNDTDYEGPPSSPIFVTNPPDITIPIGEAGVGVFTTSVFFNYANSGFEVGQEVVLTFDPVDTRFVSGTFTVSAVTPTDFTTSGGGVSAGVIAGTTQPATVSNGSTNVDVFVQLPDGVVAGDTVLVYRSFLSDSADAAPRAQYYLNKEYVITAGDITAGYFTYNDNIPDSLLQDPLYTNTDDGEPPDSSLQNDNSRAPYCLDLAEFDQRLWGANYLELQTFALSLLGTGAPNGLQAGDTIQLSTPSGGAAFFGIAEASTPVIAFNQFRVYTSGDAADNVRRTAIELSQVISANTLIDMEAFYTSGVDDLPGGLLLRLRTPGAGAFSITASRPSAWSPILDTTIPTYSTARPQTNGLWFAKQNQPEAVPLLNRLSIGPRNCQILRIRPLRDKLFVFTDIAGVYVVSNSYPYQVTSLSETAVLIAPDTLVNFDDAIWALTTQGVVRFNEAGPKIMSVPIERELLSLFPPTGSVVVSSNAFAIGYESYRKYMLAIPTTAEDDFNTSVWVYDIVTETWVRWTKPIDSGIVVTKTGVFYATTPESDKVSVERKNFNRTDYADEDFQVTITTATGVNLSLISSIEPQAGDLLYQSPIARSLITSATSTGIGTYDITTLDTITWTLGAATEFPGIPCQLLNTPLFASGPEERKNYREVTYHFRTPGFSLGNGLFAGDTNPAVVEVEFAKGGWTNVAWGLFSWEQPSRPVNKRVSIPTSARRVSYLTAGFAIREAQAQWQLLGISPVFENMSERNTK